MSDRHRRWQGSGTGATPAATCCFAEQSLTALQRTHEGKKKNQEWREKKKGGGGEGDFLTSLSHVVHVERSRDLW